MNECSKQVSLQSSHKTNGFDETKNKAKRTSHTSDSVLSPEKMRECSRKAKEKDKSEIKLRGKIGGGR